uniref:Uncharacterized protein n=1 Tax=Pseudomonas phage HRDY3 TaxID=3236930 RepID=A0AB39CDR7_9VIRU
MTESVEQGFNTGLEGLEGFTQDEFEDVAKHAEKLGFTIERGDTVVGLKSLSKSKKPKPIIHAMYCHGTLEIFRNPEGVGITRSIILAGVVDREFLKESVKDVCESVTEAKTEADELLKAFNVVRREVLEHINAGTSNFTIEIVEELPDYAGYWHNETELFYLGVSSSDRYYLSSVGGKAGRTYDSVPKLKAAAKRIANKFLKDLKK